MKSAGQPHVQPGAAMDVMNNSTSRKTCRRLPAVLDAQKAVFVSFAAILHNCPNCCIESRTIPAAGEYAARSERAQHTTLAQIFAQRGVRGLVAATTSSSTEGKLFLRVKKAPDAADGCVRGP